MHYSNNESWLRVSSISNFDINGFGLSVEREGVHKGRFPCDNLSLHTSDLVFNLKFYIKITGWNEGNMVGKRIGVYI